MSTSTPSPEPAEKNAVRPPRPGSKAYAAAQRARAKDRQTVRFLIGGMAVALIAVIALVVIFTGNDADAFADSPKSAATVVAGDAFPSYIAVDGMSVGDPSAQLTIIQYGDYQDGESVRFSRDNLAKLVNDYLDEGTVRLEYHDLPITGGTVEQDGESFLAAEAARCANEQGLFWEMNHLLYANTIGTNKGSFSMERLKAMAPLAPGLDTAAFNTCLDEHRYRADVQADADAALARGYDEAPVFLVNGQPVLGNDYEELKAAIETQLAGP